MIKLSALKSFYSGHITLSAKTKHLLLLPHQLIINLLHLMQSTKQAFLFVFCTFCTFWPSRYWDKKGCFSKLWGLWASVYSLSPLPFLCLLLLLSQHVQTAKSTQNTTEMLATHATSDEKLCLVSNLWWRGSSISSIPLPTIFYTCMIRIGCIWTPLDWPIRRWWSVFFFLV